MRNIMTKGQNTNKGSKKNPMRTAKEKKLAKREKKNNQKLTTN